jgi:hypothetical protein
MLSDTRGICITLWRTRALRCKSLAPGMSAWGQDEKNSVRAYVFRFALKLGHCSMPSACLKGARSRHHSITSSARVRMTAGISSPINFAVFKLITNRNWVGCCIGSSAGFAPLKSYRHGQRRCERLPTRPGHTTSMPQREGNRRREPSWRVYLRRQIQQFAFARCRILRSARPQLRRNLQPQLLRLHVSVDPAPEPRML